MSLSAAAGLRRRCSLWPVAACLGLVFALRVEIGRAQAGRQRRAVLQLAAGLVQRNVAAQALGLAVVLLAVAVAVVRLAMAVAVAVAVVGRAVLRRGGAAAAAARVRRHVGGGGGRGERGKERR